MRILVITNLFPDRERPAFGTFIRAHVMAMTAAGAGVDVVAIRETRVHRRVALKYAWLVVDATVAALRAIWHRRRPQIVEAHIAYPTGLIAWPIARLLRSKLVLYCHGTDVTVLGLKNWVHRRVSRYLLGRADLLVANSRFISSFLQANYGVSHDRIVTWSPGIDMQRFGGGATSEHDPKQVLYVGRLDEGKGVDVLLQAMALLPNSGLRLRVLGDGAVRASLEQWAVDHSISAEFAGSVPPPSVATALAAAGILVVPSVRPEGLGLTALEGMAAGALVVASASGGLVESVEPGWSGWLVPPGNVAALRDAIGEAALVASENGEQARAMREAGRVRAHEHDIHRVAAHTLQSYAALWN